MHSFKQSVLFLAMIGATVSRGARAAKATNNEGSVARLVSRMFSFSGKLVAASAVAASLLTAAPAFAQFGTNLVVNGGAEEGSGTTDGSAVTLIPGWFVWNPATVIDYANTAGFPTAASPGPAGRGERFFAGGLTDGSHLYQEIDVQFAADAIELKSVVFDFSVWVGGYYTDNDAVYINVQFYGENRSSKGSVSLPAVNAAARNNVTGMFLRQLSGVVPAGTRYVGLSVFFYRTAGVSCDGYVDNLYLSLRNAGE